MSITKEYHDLRVYGEITSEGLTIQSPIGAADGYTFPSADGLPNQILATNGFGQLSFQNATSLALTTDDVPEGLINLYFTEERVDDRIAALIQNGIGINWTYDDPSNTFTGNVTLTPFDTDDLSEGATNLYFTNERVDDRVAQLIINGTGLTWTYNDVANTLQGVVSLSPFTSDDLIEGSTNLYFTDEAAQDAAASMIQNATGISWTYNDLGNTLTPTIILGDFTTDDLPQGMSNLYLTDEAIDDRVALLVHDTATVTWVYNDIANTLEANAATPVKIQKGGSLVSGDRDTINFIEGTDITLAVADDSVNGRVDVTISYSGIPGTGGVTVNTSEGLTTDSITSTVEFGDEIGGGGAFFTSDREVNLNGKYLEFLGTPYMDVILSSKGDGAVGIGSLFEDDLSSMLHLHGTTRGNHSNLVEKTTLLLSGLTTENDVHYPIQVFHANLDNDNNGTHITLYDEHVLDNCQMIGETRYDGYIYGNNLLVAGSPGVAATGISTLSNSLNEPLLNTFSTHVNTVEGETLNLWPGFSEDAFFPLSLDELKNTSVDAAFKAEYDAFKVFTCSLAVEPEYDISTEFAKSLSTAAEITAKLAEVNSKISESKSEYDEQITLITIQIEANEAAKKVAEDSLLDLQSMKAELEETLEKLNSEKVEAESALAEAQAALEELNAERTIALDAYNAQDKIYEDLIALLDALIARYTSSEADLISDISAEDQALIASLLSDIADGVEGTEFEEEWTNLLTFLGVGTNTILDAINECQNFKALIVQAKADADESESNAVSLYNETKNDLDIVIEENTSLIADIQSQIAENQETLDTVTLDIEATELTIAELTSSIEEQNSQKKAWADCSAELETKIPAWLILSDTLQILLDTNGDSGFIDCNNISYAEYYIGGTPYCLDDATEVYGITLDRKYTKFGQGWLYGADIEELGYGEEVEYELGHSNASVVIGTTNPKDEEKCEVPTAMLDVYGNSITDSGKFTQYPFIRFRGMPQANTFSNVYVDKHGYLWQTKGGGQEPMGGLHEKMIEASISDGDIDNLKYHYKLDGEPGPLSTRDSILDSVGTGGLILSTNNGLNSIDRNFSVLNQSLRLGGDSVLHATVDGTIPAFANSISIHAYFDKVNTGSHQLIMAIADDTDGIVMHEKDGKLYAGVYTSSGGEGNQAICETLILEKKWYHISLVFDTGDQSVKLYLDKILVNTISLASLPNISGGISGLIDNTMMVGGIFGTARLPYGNTSSVSYTSELAPHTQSFKGYIDDIRIYWDALTASEVQALGTVIEASASVRLGGDLIEATDINVNNSNFKIKSDSLNTNYLNIGSYQNEESRAASEDLNKELDKLTDDYNTHNAKLDDVLAKSNEVLSDSKSSDKDKESAQTDLDNTLLDKAATKSKYDESKTEYDQRISEEDASGDPIWEVGCAENLINNGPVDTMLSKNGKLAATENIQIRIGEVSNSYESTFSSTSFTPEGLFYTLRNSNDNTGTGVKFQIGNYVTNEWITDGRAILINTSATQGETFYNSSHYARHNSIHKGNETQGQTGGANYGGAGQIKSEYFSWNYTSPTSPGPINLYTNPDTQEEIVISPAKNTGHFFFESVVMGMGECEPNSITIKLKGSARVDAGGNAALIGSVTKTVESTNGVSGATTADYVIASGTLGIQVSGEVDDIMMWSANTIIHGMTWNSGQLGDCAKAEQSVYIKCDADGGEGEDNSCGDGTEQITTLGLVGGWNNFRYGCCWYILNPEGVADDSVTTIDPDMITPHSNGEATCESIAGLYGTTWENCVTKETKVSLCCTDEINHPADVVISNLFDLDGVIMEGCWKKIGYATTESITAQCPEEFIVPNRACEDDDCQPPSGYSWFLCEGQEGCEISDFKLEEQIAGSEIGTEKARFQCCWYEYRELESSSNSVTIPGHIPLSESTCADAIKIDGIQWKKCGSEELRYSVCCPSETQYMLGDIIDNLRDAGCKSNLPGCWEYLGAIAIPEDGPTACCPAESWNVLDNGECPEQCTDSDEYFVLIECQEEEELKKAPEGNTIQAGAQSGYIGNGTEIVIYDGKCWTVKSGGESQFDSLTLIDFTIGDCICCINRSCVVATKYVDCEAADLTITVLSCGDLSPGDWIDISGECYNITDGEPDLNNCISYAYTKVENCEVCARGGVDVKFTQDGEDGKKYKMELKSKEKEIALRKFELDAEPADGAKISIASIEAEVFDSETWTSTVVSDEELRGDGTTDWTVTDGEGFPNPATLPLDVYVESADIEFDKEVDLEIADIKNQVWTRDDGSVIPSGNIVITIELADDGKK